MRYFFEIAYKGTQYAGWQSQKNALGVQEVMEDALTKLLREEIKIVGSGRTDTGVHCRQQFFHTDLAREIDTDRFMGKINSFLPRDISIHSIRRVTPDAHARFSAISRSYEYHITLKKDPFAEGAALHYFKPLNIQTMNEASALLLGAQDFACFSKVKTDVNHFLCDIRKAEWHKKGNQLVFHITANRFLRGMVRAIVGTLLSVGEEKITLKDFKKIINSKDRRKAGANVPPHGLYLVQVKYPSSLFIK